MEQAIQQTWSLVCALTLPFRKASHIPVDLSLTSLRGSWVWEVIVHTLSLSTEVSHPSSLLTISNSKIGSGDRKKMADIVPGGVVFAKFWVKQTEK